MLDALAAAFGLFGAIVGAYGTYLLTRWYQPFGFLGLVASLFEILGKLVTGRKSNAIREIERQANFSELLNPDNKATSLFGIYLVLIGFALQLVGSLSAMTSAFVHSK
ncbi:MAG: hypothetical protein WBX38_15630 [Candidatus Sulfotelmatobacter sp.]